MGSMVGSDVGSIVGPAYLNTDWSGLIAMILQTEEINVDWFASVVDRRPHMDKFNLKTLESMIMEWLNSMVYHRYHTATLFANTMLGSLDRCLQSIY